MVWVIVAVKAVRFVRFFGVMYSYYHGDSSGTVGPWPGPDGDGPAGC